jgi:hypothetical protein
MSPKRVRYAVFVPGHRDLQGDPNHIHLVTPFQEQTLLCKVVCDATETGKVYWFICGLVHPGEMAAAATADASLHQLDRGRLVAQD